MNSDKDKPQVPARRHHGDTQIQAEAKIQTDMVLLTKSGAIDGSLIALLGAAQWVDDIKRRKLPGPKGL